MDVFAQEEAAEVGIIRYSVLHSSFEERLPEGAELPAGTARYLCVRLEATNRDGKPRAPASKFKLLDEAGNEYEMLAASRREALKRKLNPGVSTAVTLIYEVAEGEQHT